MLCAGLMMAHQVAGKSTRDAFFLTYYAPTDLAKMFVAGALASLALGWVFSRALSRFGPRRVVPGAFVLSALIQFGGWLLMNEAPRLVVVAMYLHIVAFGAVLLSGFWSLANELFDPAAAKKRFGRIAGAGTIGGILGGALTAGIPGKYALLMLAVYHLLTAVGMVALRSEPGAVRPPEAASVPAREVFRRAPYLKYLAALVLLGTASAAIIDIIFKMSAKEVFSQEGLLRFFAIYNTTAQLLSSAVQTFLTRPALTKFGIGRTVASLPVSVALGGLFGMSYPAFPSYLFIRGTEQVLRGSLFRSAYELFYTPVPPAEKRSAKTLIDVSCDRLGDAAGGGIVQLFLWFGSEHIGSGVLGATVALATVGVWIALRLDKVYEKILEHSLVNRADELDLSDINDPNVLSDVLRTRPVRVAAPARRTEPTPPAPRVYEDAVFQDLRALRSGDVTRVRAQLAKMPPIDKLTAPQVIRLLAWNEVSERVREVLMEVRESLLGQMVDSLLDTEEDFAIRRRIPRILAYCEGRRAAIGLLEALEDQRFEVRFQCSRALDVLHLRQPDLKIPEQRIYAVLDKELSVSRAIWQSRRLLDQRESNDNYAFLDEHLRERADQSLEHIFSLLALILPREPLKIAFRALHTDDRLLRGLGREYLDSTLPVSIRRKLWEVVDAAPAEGHKATPEQILEKLNLSSESLLLKIQERGIGAEDDGKTH